MNGLMHKRAWTLAMFVLTLACAIAAPSVFAQEVQISPQYLKIQDFKFVSGETLAEMVVEYGTIGTKQTDAQGNITNAIVWCHGFSGNYTQIKDAKDVVGPGKAIDTNKFFIICPTAIGSPGSSSPSTSKMGPKFPKYTPRDMANAQYRLVSEQFRIKHLKGVIGASMGGFQTLEWAINYPDFMDFIIAIATGYETKGRMFGNALVSNNAIKKDPHYKDGNYTEPPVDGLAQGAMAQFLWYMSAAFYREAFPTNEVFANVLMGEGKKAANSDANDMVWRNNNLMAHNVKDRVGAIKAKALLIGINQDEVFPPDTDLMPLAKSIPGAKLFMFDSMMGHVGAGRDLEKAETAIAEFVKGHSASAVLYPFN